MNEEFDVSDFGSAKEVLDSENDLCSTKSVVREDKDASPRVSKPDGTYSYSQWSEIFFDSFIATGVSQKKLPAGLYSISVDDRGRLLFTKRPIYSDDCLKFDDSISDRILSEIDQFWKLGKDFSKYKFLHRRGYLLYGPAGGGKSIIIQQVIEGIIKNEGIAIWADGDPYYVTRGVETIRMIEPYRPIVVIFEDIDTIIENHGEARILSYLDGEGSVDVLLNIATTNYPKKLDKRIIARPRRFDRVEKITVPSKSVRHEYFKIKMNIEGEELEKWARSTEGFSFAALADLIISVKCFGYPFEEAVEKLKKLLDSKFKDEYDFKNTSVGFENNGSE